MRYSLKFKGIMVPAMTLFFGGTLVLSSSAACPVGDGWDYFIARLLVMMSTVGLIVAAFVAIMNVFDKTGK